MLVRILSTYLILIVSQLPNFPAETDTAVPIFGFSQFISAVLAYRTSFINSKTIPDQIPNYIQAVATLFSKSNINDWVLGPFQNLFTWSDYYLAFAIRANLLSNMGSSNMIEFLTYVCYFYWYMNKLSTTTPDTNFQSFLNHIPYDYSRPNNWCSQANYVSYAEALRAVITLQDQGPTEQLTATIASFQNQFSSYSYWDPKKTKLTTVQQMTIRYDLYSSCFDSLSNSNTIQPYDFEICVYYCLQQNLDLGTFVCVQKAAANQSKASTPQCITLLPSLKWFDEFNWLRFYLLSAYFYYVNQGSGSPINLGEQWKTFVKPIYSYTSSQQSGYNGIGYQGLTILNPDLQFGFSIRSFSSFVGYPLFLAMTQFTLSQQMTEAMNTWAKHKFAAGTSQKTQDAKTLAFQITLFSTYKAVGQMSTILYIWQNKKKPKLSWSWGPDSKWISGATPQYLRIINSVQISNQCKEAMNLLKGLTPSKIPLVNPGVLSSTSTSQNSGQGTSTQAATTKTQANTQELQEMDTALHWEKAEGIVNTVVDIGFQAAGLGMMAYHFCKKSPANDFPKTKSPEDLTKTTDTLENSANNKVLNSNPSSKTLNEVQDSTESLDSEFSAKVGQASEAAEPSTGSPDDNISGAGDEQPDAVGIF